MAPTVRESIPTNRPAWRIVVRNRFVDGLAFRTIALA